VSLADDVQRLTAVVWSMHREQLLFPRLTGFDGSGMGRAAKATGCTVSQLEAMMAGEVEPTCSQALAALSALYTAPVAAGANGRNH
jgi:hypothetical protein